MVVAMQNDMATTLKAHHQQIENGLAEIVRHCSLAMPDMSLLGAARVKLSRASAARTRYISDTVIPALMPGADPALKAELEAMQRTFSAKRLASSEHVNNWTSQSIEKDWDGYRAASREIRRMMEEQIERERAILLPRLT